MISRASIAELPLHYGTTPRWLFERMVKLAHGIVTVIVDEYSTAELLRRLSDAVWFQAFSCVLGFDWHSSGTTTVTCGVLKNAISPSEFGIAVCGGKGQVARKTPHELEKIADLFSFSSAKLDVLKYSSKLAAKVDNTALQDGYQLYHHVIIVTEKGEWCVVQQGLSPVLKTARRYHWLGEKVVDFVNEPHNAIISDLKQKKVLDMTSEKSASCRDASVDIVNDDIRNLKSSIQILPKIERNQKTLDKWLEWCGDRKVVLKMPFNINWDALKRAYEYQPRDYEELISIDGIGPKTVRALALISEVIHGAEPSWHDPVRYTFAHGGKDGVPYPVNKRVMDKTIELLTKGIDESKVGKREKLDAIKRLKDFMH